MRADGQQHLSWRWGQTECDVEVMFGEFGPVAAYVGQRVADDQTPQQDDGAGPAVQNQ